MSQTLKKLFLTFLLTELLFAYAPAFAQAPAPSSYYTGVSGEIEKYLCNPTSGGTGILYQCINQIYKFAIVTASIMGVFFIVIAGYVYMSAEGNKESVDKAKDILVSTITSLVILLAGYVLLNALNPDLIQFHGNTLQPVNFTSPPTTTITTSPGGAGSTAPAGSAAQLASQILANPSITLNLSHPSGISDPASTAKQNIVDTSNGLQAHDSCYSQGGITAPCLSVTLSTGLLQGLVSLGSQMSYTVVEIAGGVHSSSPTDSHYQGRAVDVVPASQTAASQSQMYSSFNSASASQIAVECDIAGQPHIFTILNASTASTYTTCLGQSGYHIHAAW
jgi:hypothetical protein